MGGKGEIYLKYKDQKDFFSEVASNFVILKGLAMDGTYRKLLLRCM